MPQKQKERTEHESDNNGKFRLQGDDGADCEHRRYIREARDEKKRKRETEDKLLDTAQAAKMLNVSKRTMQRMRTDHRIEYVVVRGSCRYRLSEILRLLEDNTVRNEEGTIDTLFHNHTLRTGGKPKGRRT